MADALSSVNYPVFSVESSFICLLQSGPNFIRTHKIGLNATNSNAASVYVHPLPIAPSIGMATAVDPALNKQRIKLLAAVAIAGLSG